MILNPNPAGWSQVIKDRMISFLEANLDDLDLARYQGSHLERAPLYALGYLLTGDPRYFGKAVGLVRDACYAYQKAGFNAFELVGRGDGVRARFPVRPGARQAGAWTGVARPWTKTVTRGTGNADRVEFNSHFLDVAGYVKGVDWAQTGDGYPSDLAWLSEHRPAPGSSYTVTLAAPPHPPQRATLSGNELVLPSPPAAGDAVFAAYLYDEDGALYQPTTDNLGGFCSAYSDTGYTSRWMGKCVALTLDWLWDGPWPEDLRDRAMSLLVRWADHFKANGYMKGSLQSNYSLGAYCSWVLTGLCLRGRHPEGQRVLDEAVAFRLANLHQINGPSPSLRGGWYAEGWSYGPLATANLLLPALALEHAGLAGISVERQWASEVARQFYHLSSDGKSIYDGGDWFAYPAPLYPSSANVVIGEACDDPAARRLARGLMDSYTPGENFIDLLFPDFFAETPGDPSVLPLDFHAEGTSLVASRSDWGSEPVLVTVQCGKTLWADHQSYTPGQVQVRKGTADLLINGTAPGRYQGHSRKSHYGNVVTVDAGDKTVQTYLDPPSMGLWYGFPGPRITRYAATAAGFELACDYGQAYSHHTAPGRGGPVKHLSREVVYRRPNVVVVYDRVEIRRPEYKFALQWAALQPPIRDGNGWRVNADGHYATVRVAGHYGGPEIVRTERVGYADVSFLTFSPAQTSPVCRFVTVIGVDHTPDIEWLLEDGVMVGAWVDDTEIRFDPMIPEGYPEPSPTPPPGPVPGPKPQPEPTRDMPEPIFTLGPRSFNGEAVDLGDLLKNAPDGLAVVVRYKKIGGPYNFPLLRRNGQFEFFCHPSAGGAIVACVSSAGTNSATIGGDVNADHTWAASFAGKPEGWQGGIIKGYDGAVDVGNQPWPGTIPVTDAPLVINPSGGVFELEYLALYATHLSGDEMLQAMARAEQPVSPPPSPLPSPPPPLGWVESGRTVLLETAETKADLVLYRRA